MSADGISDVLVFRVSETVLITPLSLLIEFLNNGLNFTHIYWEFKNVFRNHRPIPSSKLTWQWKFTFSNREYIVKWWIFQPAMLVHQWVNSKKSTLQGTNISPKNGILKMIFLFLRWDMLVPWRVSLNYERTPSLPFPSPLGRRELCPRRGGGAQRSLGFTPNMSCLGLLRSRR